MAEGDSKKTILGYVSAYLKQTPRTYAEAERDHRAQKAWAETGEPEGSPPKTAASRPPANEK